jgi:predicted PurR-regulated permease PerM
MPERNAGQSLISPLTRTNLILMCIGFLTAALILLIEALPDITVLLAATLLVTYLLKGPVQFAEKKLSRLQQHGKPLLSSGFQRTLAIIVVYLAMFGLIVLSALHIIPPLAAQIQEYVRDIPQTLERIQNPGFITAPSLFKNFFPAQQQWLASTHLMQKIAIAYTEYFSRLGEYLLNIGASALSGLVYTLTMLVLVFILLQDGATLKKGFVELMPNQIEGIVSEFLNRFHRHAFRFIQAQAAISVLGGSMVYLLLFLLSSKYALLLGVVYGLLSLIPVVGPWMGFFALIGFVTFGAHPEHVLPLILYIGAFCTFKAYWLRPRLLPKHTDIHPIIFLIMLLMSIRLAGIFGVLLAFPLASVLGVLVDYLREASGKDAASPLV